MSSFEVGLVLIHGQDGPERTTARWSELRAMAQLAEQVGFDTVWTIDELLWRPEGRPLLGFWEGISICGAVAASTSRIKVGTWVMSALHRNPGIIAKAAETLDEISGGRFVFGLGAGHAGPGQARSFGLPEEQLFARFEDALEIIMPLMRDGRADFEGKFHAARDLVQVPVGPRPGKIPIMIGGHGPRAQRLAARYSDIWSCYAEKRSVVEELLPLMESFKAVCAELGRDPQGYGLSAGVEIKPLAKPAEAGDAISGSAREIADAMLTFRSAGFTQLEIMLTLVTVAAVEALAPALEALRSDLDNSEEPSRD